MIKVIGMGPGATDVDGLEDLLDMLFGPPAPKELETHILRFDDDGEDHPKYLRFKADGEPGDAPSTLTDKIEEAQPIPEKIAVEGAKRILRDGPCTCPNTDCPGRYCKAVAMKIPEGWVSKPFVYIPVDPATPVQ